MTSIGTMIKRIAGLYGTPDLSAWETKFVASISDMTDSGEKTVSLSEKQIECIERIHNKHFAV
ncbi:MAG: hypothetical protein OEV31_06335 [Gammaproteobacteria bacterium]|nr:hypothetical protein [Gammaproteobacteria bacterium]